MIYYTDIIEFKTISLTSIYREKDIKSLQDKYIITQGRIRYFRV